MGRAAALVALLLVRGTEPAARFERLHRGPRHAEVYADFAAARAACDAEGRWAAAAPPPAAGAADVTYQFHGNTSDWVRCAAPTRRPPVAAWAANATGCGAQSRRRWAGVGTPVFRCASKRYAPSVVDPAEDERGPGRGRWAPPVRRDCEVATAGGTWAFVRLGPFVGAGNYDWHSVMLGRVGPARGEPPWAVDAWSVAPTDEAGASLSFPPVHLHHAHLRWRPLDGGDDDARGGAEGEGALVFEAHADSNCAAADGGPRCFLRALPAGAAIDVAKALTFDAQFNDVRSRDAAASVLWP